MNHAGIVVFIAVMGAGSAWADLKPDIVDCDPKKAARNAAMDATVGVSGRCDAGKVAKDTKDDVADAAKDIKPQPLDKDKRKLRPNKD